MSELVLDTSFEELKARFPENQLNGKLMEFVEPLPELEGEINEVASSLAHSGKLLFVLGQPGAGKSTFAQSLSWRPHLRIASFVQVDGNEFTADYSLNVLFEEFSRLAEIASAQKDKGPTIVVVDYLENLVEFDPQQTKGFFRRLNGLLRTSPLLILWPVTNQSDVDQMRSYAAEVSGTLFYRGKEVLHFHGPREDRFVDITKRTVAVVNDGHELSDFSLTTDDLEEALGQLRDLPALKRTLREYLELVKERWRQRTDYQARVRANIPKTTEVWFQFSYRDAESVVAQFVRRSHRSEDSWAAINDKFFEYIHKNTQRSAIWNATRLQLALYGAIKTRLMFLPTQALVACVAAYSTNSALNKVLQAKGVRDTWRDKADAKRMLGRTALYKQAVGEILPVGKRKSGPAAAALKEAEPIFDAIVGWMTSGGSDSEINKCIGTALQDLLGFPVRVGESHPWIPNLIPDLFIDLGAKQICVEFHHTTKDEPGVIADYVLKKLNIYMSQLEQLQQSHSA